MGLIVKNTTYLGLGDILCPYSCKGCGRLGEVFCECCKNDIIFDHLNCCPGCQRVVIDGCCNFCHLPPIFVVGWKDDIIGQLVQDYKYESTRALGCILAEILDSILPVIDGKVEIVPLPTAQKHIRERGFDHTRKVAQKLARKRGWKVSKMLIRKKDTVQVGTNEKMRVKQANEAYEATKKAEEDVTYVIFDDVWTTGASMRAAIKKLRKAGARKIMVAILAVSRTRD